MKIRQALEEIAELQPNSFGTERMIRWLRQLDMELWREVILTHDGAPEQEEPDYSEDTDVETELLVKGPYESIYIHWLQSRIDYALAEYGRFNNSNAAFEADRAAWRMQYNRSHMPVQAARGKYF